MSTPVGGPPTPVTPTLPPYTPVTTTPPPPRSGPFGVRWRWWFGAGCAILLGCCVLSLGAAAMLSVIRTSTDNTNQQRAAAAATATAEVAATQTEAAKPPTPTLVVATVTPIPPTVAPTATTVPPPTPTTRPPASPTTATTLVPPPSPTASRPTVAPVNTGQPGTAWLGITYQTVNAEVAKQRALAYAGGLWVTDVTVGSPAEKAGIQVNDWIWTINGTGLDKDYTLTEALATRRPGDKIIVSLMRGTQPVELNVELGSR